MKVLFVVFMIFGATVAQPIPDGIFIIKKPSKKNPCEHELKMLIGGKNVCILPRPIVGSDGFAYATDILYSEEKKVNYVNLWLNSESGTKLNETIKLLPNSEFALVVDNDVICIFTIHGHMDTRNLSIGEDLPTKDLVIVRNALKKFQR